MLRRCIFIMMMTCVPMLSQAFDFTNWYLRGSAGLNFISIPTTSKASIDTDAGFVLIGSVGYRFSERFRAEGELAYRRNSLDQLVLKGHASALALELDGSISSIAGMANVLFDLPVNWTFLPYLGVGLGGFHEWTDGRVSLLIGTPQDIHLKSNIGGPAYQLIAGMNLLRFCNIDTGIEYRFFDSLSNPDSGRNHTLAISCRRVF
jgi:OmpA-OmpF porin, OOP family